MGNIKGTMLAATIGFMGALCAVDGKWNGIGLIASLCVAGRKLNGVGSVGRIAFVVRVVVLGGAVSGELETLRAYGTKEWPGAETDGAAGAVIDFTVAAAVL